MQCPRNPPSVPSYIVYCSRYSIQLVEKPDSERKKRKHVHCHSSFRGVDCQRLREELSQNVTFFLMLADDTDPYVEANDYPPSPESWIGEAPSGMEPGPGAGVPYE